MSAQVCLTRDLHTNAKMHDWAELSLSQHVAFAPISDGFKTARLATRLVDVTSESTITNKRITEPNFIIWV